MGECLFGGRCDFERETVAGGYVCLLVWSLVCRVGWGVAGKCCRHFKPIESSTFLKIDTAGIFQNDTELEKESFRQELRKRQADRQTNRDRLRKKRGREKQIKTDRGKLIGADQYHR